MLLCARDDVDALTRVEAETAARTDPPRSAPMTRQAWDQALELYYADHDGLDTDADARGPAYFSAAGRRSVAAQPAGDEDTMVRIRRVRQTLADPAGDRDWVLEAVLDLDASDELGDVVLLTTALRRMD